MLGFGAGRRIEADQLGQGIRYFDARKKLFTAAVADQHRQVQAQVGDMREGTAGVERQWGQHRKHRIRKIARGPLQLRRGQLGIIVHVDVVLSQFGHELVQAPAGFVLQLLGLPPDGHQLASRAHAVGTHFHGACLHLGR